MKIRAKNLLNHTEQSWIVDEIRDAEKNTSGEIRVHLEDYSLIDPFDRASEVFGSLEMQNTRYRNGVLIYIAVVQHQFVIMGDHAINEKVNESYWNSLSSKLIIYFQREEFFEGLSVMIKEIGETLKKYFPLGNDDNPNELPNTISFG